MSTFLARKARNLADSNNSSVLPPLEYKTNGRLAAVNIKEDDIYLKNIKNLNPKKLMDGTTYQLG